VKVTGRYGRLALPFVEIDTRTKREAVEAVEAFNSDPELGPPTEGFQPAHIPVTLLRKYGFIIP
jgi:hypothetical protein